MARFATVSKNELKKLLADKDAENTKKSDKAGCEHIHNVFKGKKD